MEIKKILAPTDLSQLSAKGVEYAAELAAKLGAEVIVWHAVRIEEFRSLARMLEDRPEPTQIDQQLIYLTDRHRELLHEFAARHLAKTPGVGFTEVVEIAEPQNAIPDWAKTNGIDLIVMSTHGRSGISRALMGSVTERVLRQAPCPVVAVPVHER
jgi:nucleotide-binding universal stress UspA family protein